MKYSLVIAFVGVASAISYRPPRVEAEDDTPPTPAKVETITIDEDYRDTLDSIKESEQTLHQKMPEFKKIEEKVFPVNKAVQAQLAQDEKNAQAATLTSLTEAEKEAGHKLSDKVMVTNPMAQNAQVKQELASKENTVVFKSY